MGMKFGKGTKMNGKEIQETKKKKIVTCTNETCSFGKKEMDDFCAICRYRKDFIISSKVIPIFIELTDQYVIQDCFKKPKIPMYGECPNGFKEVSTKCEGCARAVVKLLGSQTTIIK